MGRAFAGLAPVLAALALAPAATGQSPAPGPEPPAPAPPPPGPEQPRIAPGVSAAGVELGGLTVEEAAGRLETALGRRLRAPVTVRVARSLRFRLRMARIRLRLDAARTARRAYKAGLRRPTGAPATPIEVPLAVELDRPALRRFVRRVGRSVFLAPRNATLRITLRRMIRRRSYRGRKLRQRQLGAALLRALRDPRKPRVVRGRRRSIRARTRYGDLERIYPTVLTIDRSGFTLRLFKRLRHDRSYPIAVGMAGYDTPGGLFRIQSKRVNPAWHAPNRPWAGAYAGRTVPGGAPDNPLKARWLGVASGVGIHGTGEPWSIGTRASHGCIRMHVHDVIELYARVPIGTPVLIR